jgi:putative inorganic carbon (HCO3(-)) transporter
MPGKEKFWDYEPLGTGRARPLTEPESTNTADFFADPFSEPKETETKTELPEELSIHSGKTNWLVRRGHAFSFIGIFLFTIAVYLRPYEFIPALWPLRTMAFWIALVTALAYVPTQLGLEGNLTSRPREVNLLLLFGLTVLLSVPFADDPAYSFGGFLDFIKVILIFVVLVNVVRTESRWKILLFLLLAISCFLSVSALRNYRSGVQLVEGFRVKGSIGNMLENPNDMALHLVTMLPISVGLLLSTKNQLAKLFYLGCAMLMLGGIAVTFSRGGFLGLFCAAGLVIWKLRKRHRFMVVVATVVLAGALLLFAPGAIADRFSTVFDKDQGSSVGARKDDLKRSLLVTARHPLFGIGIGNYMFRSNRALATHNSYTQVSSELGVTALVLYVLFIITPLKRLRAIEKRHAEPNAKTRYYYLAVCMQASLIGYMVSSFFASVAFLWYVYYLVGLALCLSRLYEIEQGIGVTKPVAEVGINGASMTRASAY